MKKKQKQKFGSLGLLIGVLFIGMVAYLVIAAVKNSQFKSYTSEALKISFQYPKDWYFDEKDYSILLTSYKTKIGENKQPLDNEIRLDIDRFSGCHKTIEENLKDPACGEGGQFVKNNQILSKETKKTNHGIFYKYVTKTPNGVILTYFLLESGDKIIQISKKPDPSQYEKEFDQIINSIEFK